MYSSAASLYIEMSTTPPPQAHESSVSISRYESAQCWAAVNTRASHRPCCSPQPAVCLTTGLPSFPFCSHVFLSAITYQHRVQSFLWILRATFCRLSIHKAEYLLKNSFPPGRAVHGPTSLQIKHVCHILLAQDFETTYGAKDYEMSVSAVPQHFICQNSYCCGYIRI